jgi:hypothetical protein
MKNNSQCVPATRPDSTDPMTQVDAVYSSGALNWPVMDRKNHGVPLVQANHFGPGLHSGSLLRQHELSSGKILLWH